MLLAVDTSTRYAGVALWNEGRVISCRSWNSAVNHTAELMPAVAQPMIRRFFSSALGEASSASSRFPSVVSAATFAPSSAPGAPYVRSHGPAGPPRKDGGA